MIRTLTAATCEIDDVTAAVNELLAGIDLKKNLLKNSVGLIQCHEDFIESGVVEELSRVLPFPTAGCTTMAASCKDTVSIAALTLTVLTGDDVEFSAAVTGSLFDELEKPIGAAYNEAVSKLGGAPSFIIAFAPLINHVGGDVIVESLDKLTGGIPVFGTMAIDHTMDYRYAQTIFCGKAGKMELPLILVKGCDPKFYVVSISDDKVQKQKSIITASNGNVLMEVNGMSIMKYLETLGLASDNKMIGANVIPFVIDYNDGTKPVARAIFATTPEGYAVCGGVMPVNATLGIGSIDREDVVKTSSDMVEQVLRDGTKGVLMFSCLARFLVLGEDFYAEMNNVSAALKDKTSYQLSYSGGEICPIYTEKGRAVNRFHNDSLIVCVL